MLRQLIRQPPRRDRIYYPIDRAKSLAGGVFDLRVEATGVKPKNARIEINVTGPNGPAEVLVGEPVRAPVRPTTASRRPIGA